ncbi:MAG: diguanylate cyclase [Veillonellales bacterium]
MSKKNEELFEEEKEVLRFAASNLASQRYYGNDLLPCYKRLARDYQKLFRTTTKIFRISDRQEQILQRRQNELQNLLDNANQGFLTFGRDLKVDQQYSAECIRIFGKKIAGNLIISLLSQDNNTLQRQLQAILKRVFLADFVSGQTELQRVPAAFQISGKSIRVECKLLPQPDDSDECFLVMMMLTDITEKLKAEERIRFLSYHDKLTMLNNRAYVESVLLAELARGKAVPLSVVMADMNGLKLVNDVFGHRQGDLLLTAMANVLKKSCRQTDVIARWGGDEFVIIMPSTDESACSTVCERIRRACDANRDCVIALSSALGAATTVSGNLHLTELLSIAEHRMYNDKLIKSKNFRRSIVANMENMLISRCFVNEGHNARVLQLATEFIEFLDIEKAAIDIKLITRLSVLHDIGKVTIPVEILGKQGPLTPQEWSVMKNHSETGYRMAQSIGEPLVADIILALHEHWDGMGYPFGLKGDKIPLLARIFSLVDSYDSMTHDRPYKRTMNKKAALGEIESQIGSQFDPKLAEAFLMFIGMGKKSGK